VTDIVLYRSCQLNDVVDAIRAGKPCIASVNTLFLPYSQIEDAHAVVVIDATNDAVTVLDPATDEIPKVVTADAFLAAWIERDCALAVVTKASRTQ
jgi:predicted double-glycine peptidase